VQGSVLDRWKKPGSEYRKGKTARVTKGILSYKLFETGFDDGYTYGSGHTYKVKITPFSHSGCAGADMFYDAYHGRYYKGIKELPGTTITYKWFYYSASSEDWIMIPGATTASWTVTSPYAYEDIGVLWTIKKKGYTTGQGFSNTLSRGY
jgi:hypothetical protein